MAIYPENLNTVARALPGEGKTSLVFAFGRLIAARTNKSFGVLDRKLQKSSVYDVINDFHTLGLVDYVQGETSFEDIIQIDDPMGMRFIFSGSASTNPAHLLR